MAIRYKGVGTRPDGWSSQLTILPTQKWDSYIFFSKGVGPAARGKRGEELGIWKLCVQLPKNKGGWTSAGKNTDHKIVLLLTVGQRTLGNIKGRKVRRIR